MWFCQIPCASLAAYAFYNCYHFSRLELPAAIQEIGHGAFMNCTNFREATLRGDAQGRTCLPELLGQVSGEIQAALQLPAGEVRIFCFRRIRSSGRTWHLHIFFSAGLRAQAIPIGSVFRAVYCRFWNMIWRLNDCCGYRIMKRLYVWH